LYPKIIEWLTPRFSRRQYVLYFVGCLMFSVGADFFIGSHLGTDPLDVFSLGLLMHIPITVGIAQAGFALLCLAVWSAWNRKVPPISPLVTFFFCGSLIDLWMYWRIDSFLHFNHYALMLTGAALCAYGSALIIMSGIGIRAMDLVAITMTRSWQIPFWLTKGVMELLLLATGWWLGGPVGIGTICFLVAVGWMIQPLMTGNEKFLRIPNYGMPPQLLQSI
jgi:uncharacterized protein